MKKKKGENIMNSNISGKLLALRKQNGYSQEELAERLGVSRQAVSKWERGEASPDTENLITLAKLYHISLDKLFDLSEDTAEQRVSINLEKKSAPQPEIIYEDMMPGAADGVKNNNTTTYKEPESNYSAYFKYETVDDAQPEEKSTSGYSDKVLSVAEKIQNDGKFYKSLMKFPYPIAVLAAFLVSGAFFNLWHPMWMLFLTIPLYYTTIPAIKHRNPNIFCYPVLVSLLYLIAGFTLNLWHPGWLAFMTIPAYYWAINMNKDEKEKNI